MILDDDSAIMRGPHELAFSESISFVMPFVSVRGDTHTISSAEFLTTRQFDSVCDTDTLGMINTHLGKLTMWELAVQIGERLCDWLEVRSKPYKLHLSK